MFAMMMTNSTEITPDLYFKHLDMLKKIEPGVTKQAFLATPRYQMYAKSMGMMKFPGHPDLLATFYEGVIRTSVYISRVREAEGLKRKIELEKAEELAKVKKLEEEEAQRKILELAELKKVELKKEESVKVPIEGVKVTVLGLYPGDSHEKSVAQEVGVVVEERKGFSAEWLQNICGATLGALPVHYSGSPEQTKPVVDLQAGEFKCAIHSLDGALDNNTDKVASDMLNPATVYLFNNWLLNGAEPPDVSRAFMVAKKIGATTLVEGKIRSVVGYPEMSRIYKIFTVVDGNGVMNTEVNWDYVEEGGPGYGECRAFLYDGLQNGDVYSSWFIEVDEVFGGIISDGVFEWLDGYDNFSSFVSELVFQNKRFVYKYFGKLEDGIGNPPSCVDRHLASSRLSHEWPVGLEDVEFYH